MKQEKRKKHTVLRCPTLQMALNRSPLQNVTYVQYISGVHDVFLCFLNVVERVYAAQLTQVVLVPIDINMGAVEAACGA